METPRRVHKDPQAASPCTCRRQTFTPPPVPTSSRLPEAFWKNRVDLVLAALQDDPTAASTPLRNHDMVAPVVLAIHLSCSYDVLRTLKDHGADVNTGGVNKPTPLAALAGAESNPTGEDEGHPCTVDWMSEVFGKQDRVEEAVLCQQEATLKEWPSVAGYTPRTLDGKERVDMARWLIRKGAKLHVRDARGLSAADWAAKSGFKDLEEFLLGAENLRQCHQVCAQTMPLSFLELGSDIAQVIGKFVF
mmetsp:Transcript_47833/g.86236  ORF Transcript_47833/g.86236 Transcript_47833/m.86236 type:complete len:248 (-) Transcript_47833:24-767(-)